MIHNFIVTNNRLVIGGITADRLVREYGSPLYVYDAAIIKRQYQSLVDTIRYPKLKIHYACKANTNPEILKLLYKMGASIETVSIGEIELALAAGYSTDDIIFTCSNIARTEQQQIMKKGIRMNLDSLTQIRRFGEMSHGGSIGIRINQGIGAGAHEHIITGGPDSKFGILLEQIDEAIALTKQYNLTIVGIQQHIGSNILDEAIFMQAISKLLETASLFPKLEYLDFGGGFGVPYVPDEQPLSMRSLGAKITSVLTSFMQSYGKELVVRFEPGRFLIAESGVLLTRVTDVKRTPHKVFVGVDSGFNQLIRPILYDAYQEVVNANHVVGKEEAVSVVGNVCESSDFLAKDRTVVSFVEDDILAILDSGAYGYAMSSNYNTRLKPVEILVENGKATVIREGV